VGCWLQRQLKQPQWHLHEGRRQPDDRASADWLRLLRPASPEQRHQGRGAARLATQLRLLARASPTMGRSLVSQRRWFSRNRTSQLQAAAQLPARTRPLVLLRNDDPTQHVGEQQRRSEGMGGRQSRSGLDGLGYSKGRHLKDRRNLHRPARDQKRTAQQEVVRQRGYRQELHRADDASDLSNA